MEKASRGSFSGRIGFVLATTGSAVGLGNIWRFPYLAAQYGGGMFLLVYVILMITFGYAMIVSETSIGRLTRKSAVGAFGHFSNGIFGKFGGWINAIIPMLIVSYYTVIGGWVCKYLFEYILGNVHPLAEDAYFGGFVSNAASSEVWFVVFSFLTLLIVFIGVEKGIERVAKFMMPCLILLALIITVYSVTRPGALEGVKYFLIPNFEHFSLMTVVAALGQMFYSLSIAMGILITYGSYMKKDVDIEKSALQIGFLDTGIAILCGLMIIPAVFAFSGGNPEMLKAGPSLMFNMIPKIFESMGFGMPVGIMFFTLVFFAALTSAISLAETCVSTFVDEMRLSRRKACVAVGLFILFLGSVTSLGFSSLSFISVAGMSVLDLLDFVSNSIMMPIAGISICLFIVFFVGVKKIEEEVTESSAFKGRKVYGFVVKYIAPIFIGIILLTSLAKVLGLINF